MSINLTSTSRRALNVSQQKPQPYFSVDDKYPEYVQIQRIVGTISGDKVIFKADTFDPNLFLRSRAFIKLNLDVQRTERNAGTGALSNENYNVFDTIYHKPGMVLANSMTSAKLTINSTSITYNEPRYWQQHITQQHCGKTINNRYLSMSGSSYPTWNGVSLRQGTWSVGRSSDDSIQDAIDSAFKDIGAAAASVKNFSFTEPLNIGPFNFMADNIDDIYSRSWYKKMSPLIPYVRQVGLELNFKDISANSLVFAYGRNVDIAPREIILRDAGITSAELILYWVKPRIEKIMSIPRSVKLQSWYVDHKIFPQVNSAGNDVIVWDDPFTFDETMNIHQIPTYMHIWATINKDDPDSYACNAVFTDTTGGGANASTSLNVNSQESRATVDDNGITIRVNILGGDDIVSQSYNKAELYRFTLKNSTVDFPWSQTKYRGDLGRYAIYPSNFSLILGEDDLNSYFVRKGQRIRDFVINITGTMTNGDGYGVDRTAAGFNVGGDKQWDLHVAFFYDRYYIELDNCGNAHSGFDSKFF